MTLRDFQKRKRASRKRKKLLKLVAKGFSVLLSKKNTTSKFLLILFIGFLIYEAWPRNPEKDLVNVTSVIDGDTLESQGQRIRLFGIDALEKAQTCRKNGRAYKCGKEAASALSQKIGQKELLCEGKNIDRYGRIVAICYVGDVDLNQWMVAQGYALAYRQYSKLYVADEEMAKAKKRGMWSGAFKKPWDYRQKK